MVAGKSRFFVGLSVQRHGERVSARGARTGAKRPWTEIVRLKVFEADHYAFRLPKAGLVDILYFAHIA